MAIFRVNKTGNYTIMSNRHFREKEMSLKAKGLLSLMFSLPDDWDYSINGLVAICKENESAIKSALTELKQFGYLKVTKEMPNNNNGGRITYIYDVFEIPIQEQQKQGLENLWVENQQVEKQGQLNTNNKKLNDKDINNINSCVNKWNALPDSIPKVERLTTGRKTKLNARFKDFGYDSVIKAIDLINQSSFLKGENKNGWVISFDWFVEPRNLTKILENTYTDRKPKDKLQGSPSFDIAEIERQAIMNDDYDI